MDVKNNNEKNILLRDHITGTTLKFLSEPNIGYIV